MSRRTPSLLHPGVAALAAFALSIWMLRVGMPSYRRETARTSAAPTTVPAQLGLWKGQPLQVEKRTAEILETDDVTLMEYHLGSEPPLWFAQVAGFGTRAAFHPPEICYVGSLYEVLERGPITVMVNGKEPLTLMRLVIGQDHQRFEAWCWFEADGRVTPNFYQQQLWLLADMVRRRPANGTLVRISTPMDQPDSTRRRLLAFVTSWDTSNDSKIGHRT